MPADASSRRSLCAKLTSPVSLCVLLAAAVLAIYWPAMGFAFCEFDDPRYYSDNAIVQGGLSPQGITWAFTTGAAANWHPLTWLSLMVDANLSAGPTDTQMPHLTNIILHAANSALLFLVLLRATGAKWRSFLVAGLFAMHALNVESVAWVSERKNVLCLFFMLLSLLAYVGFAQSRLSLESNNSTGGNKLLWFSLAMFALSLMSKPMSVTLPFVLLLLDVWPLGRLSISNFRAEDLKRLVAEKLPFFWLCILFCFVTYHVQQREEAVQTSGLFPMGGRIENALVAYTQYLFKTIWPTNLALYYPYPGRWAAAEWVGAAVLLILLSVAAVRLRQERPYLLIGWCWFLGTLVPMIGIVQVGTQGMADRYMYLPIIGIFIAAVWGAVGVAEWVQNKFHGPHDRINITVFAAGAIILMGNATAARHQLGFWKDNGTLFNHALAVTTDNPVSETLLGNYYIGTQQLDEAVKHYRRALAIDPNYELAHFDLGTALERQGQMEAAAAELKAGLRVNPDPKYFKVNFNLGLLLEKMGQRDEAIVEYKRALEVQPNFTEARERLQALEAGLP